MTKKQQYIQDYEKLPLTFNKQAGVVLFILQFQSMQQHPIQRRVR